MEDGEICPQRRHEGALVSGFSTILILKPSCRTHPKFIPAGQFHRAQGALESFTPRSVHVITLKQTQALHWIAKLGTLSGLQRANANLSEASSRTILPRQ